MTERDKHNKQAPRQSGDQTDDPGRPSQAEGDRETVEEALGEKPRTGQAGRDERARGQGQTNDPGRPSQAEGERGTGREDTHK